MAIPRQSTMQSKFLPFDMQYGPGIDGSFTVAANTTVTLNRSMYYQNLTIEAGGVLIPNGFRIYVSNLLWIKAGGKIHANGNPGVTPVVSAAAVAGGLGLNAGELGGSQAGGASTAGTNGVSAQPAAIAAAFGLGGDAGDGGRGGNGSAGASGIARPATELTFRPQFNFETLGIGNTLPVGGQSGPGGSGGRGQITGATGAAGGGGGSGGGIIFIRALEVRNEGSIEAKGGDGGAGSNVNTGNTGGGGGGAAGGGGFIMLVTARLTVAGTFNVAGGIGGAGGNRSGSGTLGTAGTNGSPGHYAIFTKRKWTYV